MAERPDYGEQIESDTRVELHPGCDLWMRGAKFGTVRAIGRGEASGFVLVKMDNTHVKNLVKLPLDRVRRAF